MNLTLSLNSLQFVNTNETVHKAYSKHVGFDFKRYKKSCKVNFS